MLDGAVAARKLAQLRLGYAEVRAPVAGVVVSRPAQVGMTAGIGAPLFVLQVDGALEWQAQVSPEDGQRLKVGTPARVTVGTAGCGRAVAAGGGAGRARQSCGFARQFVVARTVFARQGGGVDDSGGGAGARGWS